MESLDSDVAIIDGCTLSLNSNEEMEEERPAVANRIQAWMAKNDEVNNRAVKVDPEGNVDKRVGVKTRWKSMQNHGSNDGDGHAGIIEIKRKAVTTVDKRRPHFSRKCTNFNVKREILSIVHPTPTPLSRNRKGKATTSAVGNGGKHLDIGLKMKYPHPTIRTTESHRTQGPSKTENKTTSKRPDSSSAAPVVSEHVQRFWVKRESTYWKSPDNRKGVLVSDVGTNTECFERSIPSSLSTQWPPAPSTTVTMAASPEVDVEAVGIGAVATVSNEDQTPKEGNNNGPSDDGEYYEVEKVVGKITRQNKVYYQVRWKGHDEQADTWETPENMRCKDLIDDFEKERKARANANKRAAGARRSAKAVATKKAKAKATADRDIEDSLDSWFQHCDELVEQLQPPKGRGKGRVGGSKAGCKKKKGTHGAKVADSGKRP